MAVSQNKLGQTGPQGPAGPAGTNGTNGTNGAPGVGVPTGGTTGQQLVKNSNTDYDTGWVDPPNSAVWGGITGTLSNQTDLQNALDEIVDQVAYSQLGGL